MATLVLRNVKGSPLSHTELDANFTNINTDLGLKAPIASPVFTGDVTVGGDLNVAGSVTSTSVTNLSVADTIIYVNRRVEATITNAVGDGTYVTYTGDNNYSPGNIVSVTGATPASFNITDVAVFSATATEFVVASTNTDTWTSGGTAYAKTQTNSDMGLAGGYYDGSYAHTGMFRDATDNGTWKFFEGYIPEPQVTIDTGEASFALAPVAASNFIGPLTGNADTATTLATSRSIGIDGLVSGTASFDGSADITITTAFAATDLTVPGIVTATDFNSTSDVTLKDNIETLTGALGTVNRLRGVKFNWKNNGDSAIGVIAQELEQVLPQLVHTGPDGIKRVSYDSLVPVLIEAIKELSSKVDKLVE